jgi:predicted Zn-dependent protease
MFTRFAANGITTSGTTLVRSVSITSARDGRSGSTTVAEFDDASLREAVRHTEQLAALSPPDPERVPPLEPQKYADRENYLAAPKTGHAAIVPHLRSIIEAAKAKNLVAAGFVQRSGHSAAIANKQGNFGFGRTSESTLSTTVRTPDGSSSGWASQAALRVEDLDSAAAAKAAVEKCLRWKQPKRLEPGRYTVVLEPAAVADILSFLPMQLQARPAEEGRSFLSRKGGGTLLGEKLFPESITLRTDPFDSRYSALPWSMPTGRFAFLNFGGGHGTPAGPVLWVDRGKVRNLAYDRYWAAKTDKSVTPAPRNLILEGTDSPLTELISGVEHGLLVTHFFYIRIVNPKTLQLTGLTRDGLFLIEKGKITAPVVNFRFNESCVRVLQNTIALGQTAHPAGTQGDMIVPSLVAKDFLFTSISDAI